MGGAATAAAASPRRRILVVDDVELNRTLTEAVLRGATYEVDSVDDGAAAIAALDDKSYDLVLMDLEMPGLGGFETAAAIRRRNHQGDIRLAALSSRAAPADRTRSTEVGMSAHIARPIAPHALLREIERLIRQPAGKAPDPWQRQHYDEWATRLGADRMRGVLARLRGQFRDLLALLLLDDTAREDIERMAHDVASTGGMLGFLDVTRCCRALAEPGGGSASVEGALRSALEQAIVRLDDHFARGEPEVCAA